MLSLHNSFICLVYNFSKQLNYAHCVSESATSTEMDLKFFPPILPISFSSMILFLSMLEANILRVMTFSLGQRIFLNPLMFVILLLAKSGKKYWNLFPLMLAWKSDSAFRCFVFDYPWNWSILKWGILLGKYLEWASHCCYSLHIFHCT